MSGNQGMQGGMQGFGQMPQMGQAPQGMPGNPGTMPQPANQGGMGAQPAQLAPAMSSALGGGQQPVQMGQNPYQYGTPQTTNYVQQQAQMRMPSRPF